MGTRRIKVKRWKVDSVGKVKWTAPLDDPETFPKVVDSYTPWENMILGNHPLLGGPVANNAQGTNWPPRNQNLTLAALQYALRQLQQITFDPELRQRLTKEEMAKQVELYKNVIEARFGVKLCVSQNMDSDMTSMLLLVPNELFADDKGRESLADALQNIAMFILNMEDPNIE
jgi:hypothetical protein